MERHIGIIGAGVAGLHLGLYLRRHGIDTTIVTDRTADQFSASKLPNTVAHFAPTLERERQLGIDHWADARFHYTCHNYSFGGPARLEFRGGFARPNRAIDYRIYLPCLMADFEAQGGRIEIATIEAADLGQLSRRFDLLVVTSGRGALANAFGRVVGESPHNRPQRKLLAGLFTGIRPTDPLGATLSASPGEGELIDLPILTLGGMASALLFENIPGGDLEVLARLPHADNPSLFIATVLAKLEKHHPHVFDRIDTATFGLCGPNDVLQGAITPIVRQSTLDLGEGKFALAAGDVHCTVDPMLGQGANLASHSARVIGEEIVKDAPFDANFCERVDRRRLTRILGASRWTNLMLRPPSPEIMELVVAMSRSPSLCDEYTDNFGYPERQWMRFRSPENLRAWSGGHK